jgi:hypothetical protein
MNLRITYCLMILLLWITPLTSVGQIFNAGFRGGVNTNQFLTSSPGFTTGEPSIGLAGGVWLRLKLKPFSFQPEAIFSHKTGLIPYSQVNGNTDTLIRASLQHIDIPLMINLHIFRFIRLGTGPVVSLGVGERVSLTSTGANYTILIDKGVFKPTAYSWQFAGALEFRRLFLEARYELGIDKLNYAFDLPGENISLDPVFHSRTWQFTLGYKFVKRRN